MSSIRPVLVTASDTGGAGTATRRIHKGLRQVGVDSQMVVREESTGSTSIHGPGSRVSKTIAKLRPFIDELPLRLYGSPPEFSFSWLPDSLSKRVDRFEPDIVHLNWVANGFMSSGSIDDFDCPIVWRLPDMWPLTGGCHYAKDCSGYRSTCGDCPQLETSRSWDPSRLTLARKKRAVERADVTVVATTSWLATAARESAIFQDCPVKVIPNGLDTDLFKPRDPVVGRDLYGLPQDVPLILFGAVSPVSNHRKGPDLLTKAISEFAENTDTNAELVIFGSSDSRDTPDFSLPTHHTGYLNDEESLALLYAAADVTLVPSRYEGFGQVVTESMSSGTPVVAFNATGPSDTVVHEETGYLASPYDTSDFAAGIEFILSNDQKRIEMAQSGRSRAVKNYHYTKIADKYLDIYESLVH